MSIGVPIIIQVSLNSGVASGSPYGSTTATAPTGSTIVLAISVNSLGSVSSLIDSAGNTYSLATRSAVGSFEDEMWYCSNIISLPSGGTWTAVTSGTNYNVLGAAYVGGASGGFNQQANGGLTGTSNTWTTGTLASSPQIAFASMQISLLTTWNEDSTWTTLSPNPLLTTPFSYKMISGTSPVVWSPNWLPSGAVNGVVATFQATPVPTGQIGIAAAEY